MTVLSSASLSILSPPIPVLVFPFSHYFNINFLCYYACFLTTYSCVSMPIPSLLTWVRSEVVVVQFASVPVPAWLSSPPPDPPNCLHIVPCAAVSCQGYLTVYL